MQARVDLASQSKITIIFILEMKKQQSVGKKLSSTSISKLEHPPTPPTIEVGDHQITVLTSKKCRRVNIVYSCDHPVLVISKVRYPGSDEHLVVELSPHGMPYTVKCRVERLVLNLTELCEKCKKAREK